MKIYVVVMGMVYGDGGEMMFFAFKSFCHMRCVVPFINITVWLWIYESNVEKMRVTKIVTRIYGA